MKKLYFKAEATIQVNMPSPEYEVLHHAFMNDEPKRDLMIEFGYSGLVRVIKFQFTLDGNGKLIAIFDLVSWGCM